VVERFNQIVVEVIQCMFHHGHVPMKYWAKAMNTTVHLCARCPHKVVINVMPKELWSGRKQK
jgi:hypothetical protein